MIADRFGYLDVLQLDAETLAILGTVPKRWGRMDRLSRLAVVEVGRVLVNAGLLHLDTGEVKLVKGLAGLVVGTRRGSIATDLAYANTLASGPAMASPLLFGYTLANIALAEAASHFGIKGPVYSLYSENPLADARREAERWLKTDPALTLMVAGELDCYTQDDSPHIVADFVLVR